jgi:hypothetical protein
MGYRLKTQFEAFTVVEGPFERRHFEHGKTYDEVPAREAHRFEEVGGPSVEAGAPKRKKGGAD